MGRTPPRAALAGCTVALVVAGLVNAGMALAGGETLTIPGELGVAQVVLFTLVMIVPAAIVLWLLPRWFPIIAVVVAVATAPFAFVEFGAPVAWWLATMHLVAGLCAALLAPRMAAAAAARRGG